LPATHLFSRFCAINAAYLIDSKDSRGEGEGPR
jgi:hypothetical protein